MNEDPTVQIKLSQLTAMQKRIAHLELLLCKYTDSTSQLIAPDDGESHKTGPQNLLDNMPDDSFSLQEFEQMCKKIQTKTEAKRLLRNYKKRHYIVYSEQTGLYTKTLVYLDKHQPIDVDADTTAPAASSAAPPSTATSIPEDDLQLLFALKQKLNANCTTDL